MKTDKRRQNGQSDNEAPSHIADLLTNNQEAHPEAEKDANCDEQLIECACWTTHRSR